jgi:RsiW-degrading membrane proteinase PrsW (M82 family)
VFAIFVWAWNQFGNPLLLPGLIITGAFAIPLALLVFFFEVNVPRNVSLYQVIKLLLLGGIVSIVVSLVGFQWTNLDSWLGAMSAGIVEETGKALTLLLVVRNLRYRWTLNGMLFGATVGTGFGIFETAGYALNYGAGAAMQFGMSAGSQTMLQILEQRGMLSVFGSHTLYTAIVGAALWRVRGTQPFRLEMLFDPRFLRLFAFSVGLHMLWNSPLDLPFYAKYLTVGFVAWVVIMSLIQDGLRQVRDEQQRLAASAASPGVAAPADAYPTAPSMAPRTNA